MFVIGFRITSYNVCYTKLLRPNKDGVLLLPETCVITFFNEVLEMFVKKNNAVIKHSYKSEMAEFPVYVLNYKGTELCLVLAVVGSASIAIRITSYNVCYTKLLRERCNTTAECANMISTRSCSA